MDLAGWFRRVASPSPHQSQATAPLEYAVVDVETTGLYPERHDRIVEIAVIRMDASAKRLDEYCSLVNPNRDIGPTHIHGITASLVLGAPTFDEIAGDVISRIAGAVVVGHNVTFDFRFLESECRRMGFGLPDAAVLLCTMQLARRADPDLPGRKLSVCCSHFGIRQHGSHSAYHDAEATARLFIECLRRITTGASSFQVEPPPPARESWPVLPLSRKTLTRSQAEMRRAEQPSFLEKMVTRLPRAAASEPELDEYLALLDRVLEDRRIIPGESEMLYEVANTLGLSQEMVTGAHQAYLRNLVCVALADRVITPAERKDLEEVERLLSTPKGFLNRTIEDIQGNSVGRVLASEESLAGKSICFTGEFTCRIQGEVPPREFAEELAIKKGMVVKKSVTQNLDMLVTADPDSMSGKAKKEREYGIRIVAEPVFWRLTGVDFE
jgi:DNA polymerase-3 subunit epsilon